jgi:hypothetical protein
VLAYRSPDFVTWSQAKALAFARIDQLTTPPVKGRQCHMGAGLWNRGNVMIGLHGMWQDAEKPPPKGENWNYGVRIDLGLVISNDGVHYREPVPGHKMIPRGREGEWDDIALLQGHAFVNEGDRTMIWYSHWDTGGKLKNMEIGLATLRRDGFGSLSRKVPEESGHFITSPFMAKEIAVNVDGVTAEVPLSIQLLDHLDHVLQGYEAKVTTNGVRVTVSFPKPLPAGRKLALRVNYPANSAAKVYAIYLND